MQRADHVKVYRNGYSHHGIYLGGGFVVHYTGDVWRYLVGDARPMIRRDSLQCFGGDGQVVVVKHKTRFPSHTVIERAESRLGEVEYGIFENNCEHFANWCVTGEAYSDQVERGLIWASAVIKSTIL